MASEFALQKIPGPHHSWVDWCGKNMLKDKKVFLPVLGLNSQPWGWQSKSITTQPLYMHTHMHARTHIYTYICTHTCTYTYMHTHKYIYIHIHTYIHTYIYIYARHFPVNVNMKHYRSYSILSWLVL